MLLLSICQYLFSDRLHNTVSEDLSYVESCLAVLRYCSKSDISAATFLSMVTPVYQSVKQILSDGSRQPESTVLDDPRETRAVRRVSLLNPDSSSAQSGVMDIICQLIDIMSIPGRKMWI
jgi:hypothetical protein